MKNIEEEQEKKAEYAQKKSAEKDPQDDVETSDEGYEQQNNQDISQMEKPKE